MTVEEAVRYIIEERKRNRRIPHSAMVEDVGKLCKLPPQEVRNQLAQLKDEGKIALRHTINSMSVYLNE